MQISFDGQHTVEMQPGWHVRIHRARYPLPALSLGCAACDWYFPIPAAFQNRPEACNLTHVAFGSDGPLRISRLRQPLGLEMSFKKEDVSRSVGAGRGRGSVHIHKKGSRRTAERRVQFSVSLRVEGTTHVGLYCIRAFLLIFCSGKRQGGVQTAVAAGASEDSQRSLLKGVHAVPTHDH